MFHKAALTITTSAGAGLSHTTKTMKSSLSFWGVKRVFSFKRGVAASKWDEVSAKNKVKIEKKIAGMARKIYKTVHNIESLPYPIPSRFLFRIMKAMQKGNNWNPTDRNHWEQQGWLSGTKPY
jgi:hypothetical protein